MGSGGRRKIGRNMNCGQGNACHHGESDSGRTAAIVPNLWGGALKLLKFAPHKYWVRLFIRRIEDQNIEVLFGQKSVAVISKVVGPVFFTLVPQKLMRFLALPLSSVSLKFLIGPFQLAPVLRM